MAFRMCEPLKINIENEEIILHPVVFSILRLKSTPAVECNAKSILSTPHLSNLAIRVI